MSKWLYGRNLSSFRMNLASYIVLLYIVLCSYVSTPAVSYMLPSQLLCYWRIHSCVYTQELAACLLQSYNFYVRKLLIIFSRSEFAKQSELGGIGGAVSDISRTAGSFQSPHPPPHPAHVKLTAYRNKLHASGLLIRRRELCLIIMYRKLSMFYTRCLFLSNEYSWSIEKLFVI